MAVEKRLFVGGISNDSENCFEELYTRFKRFGNCLSNSFDIQGHFAYINIEFESEDDYQKLKQSFNGVKFKGNKLKVDVARMDWQARWKLENSEDNELAKTKKDQILKREWEHYKKLENFEKTWLDRIQVIPGRMRTTPRNKVQLRNVTFRINRDGHLKVYKCYKTKLWGYERNKKARDLVYKFVNTHWRDGNDHIVDRLDYSRCHLPVNSWKFNSELDSGVKKDEEQFEETAEDLEKLKYETVLDNVLEDYDFNKPVDLEEDEEDASSDYEYEAVYNESKESPKVPATIKTSTELRRDEVENNRTEVDNLTVDYLDSNSAKDTSSAEQVSVKEAPNTTERLRSLLNPDQSSGTLFKLAEESDGEIEENNDTSNSSSEEVVNDIQQDTAQLPILRHGDKGLFFSHTNSPFLHSQSQLAKLNSTSAGYERMFDSWEDKFWDSRALWTREMKGKKRDATRQLNKRNGRNKGTSTLV